MTRRQLLDLARSLDPVMRTGSALECKHCHNAIRRDDIYFLEYGDPDVGRPWWRHCAVSVLTAMHIIDEVTARAIPLVGPVPSWMSSSGARCWHPPEEMHR